MQLRIFYSHPTQDKTEGPFMYCQQIMPAYDDMWRCVGFPNADTDDPETNTTVMFRPPAAWCMMPCTI